MISSELPDQIHIDQIKKRLWCGREFGQASVLIGTGFSKNAEKASYNVSSFPLWRNLAEGMYDTLYLSSTCYTTEKIRATSGNGALKLASEYEITFGRSALDNYLLKSIDDNNYYPSELHESLLSLPWSDIFTTNYDTLLERARDSVYERKYDLVETYLDLPNKMKPRIVKLHGSFPSHRPFIITEEDFRTYPKKFAPFVNTVQQSLMENAFCLIGFSGDDPNFLNWIGWIRDNLGDSKPPIYLCGLFELEFSQSQRKLFESKGIVPIDLSPKFPKDKYTDSDIRHKKAIKWFLEELKSGEPPNNLNWPEVSEFMEPPQINPLPADYLKQLYGVWHKSRNEYPGWVVAPKKNRDKLWNYTIGWLSPILESVDHLAIPDNLYLVYELNWRLEKTLTPLFLDDCAEKISQLVEKFNPFPSYLELNSAIFRRNDDKLKEFNWKEIGEYWIELVFALMRYAREKQDMEKFSLWSKRIDKVSSEISQECKLRLLYEKCLFYLFQLDRKNAYKILQSWPEINYLPFWDAKKASILLELGKFKEAEKIAQKALNNVRSQINPYNSDVMLLSQEGWLMYLLLKVKSELFSFRISEDGTASIENDIVRYTNRWDKLEAYRCNPYTEIESLFLINGELITSPPEVEIRNTFDGGKSRIYSNILRFNRSRLLSSFSLFRLFEEAAMPINCGYCRSDYISIVSSAKRIIPYASYWSFIIIIRSGITEEIDKLLNRIVVGILSQEEVNKFGSTFIFSLEQLIEDLKPIPPSLHPSKSRFLENSIKIISEILSRLCIRFSNEELDKLYELTVGMYNLPILRQRPNLHDNLTNLFKRILYTMPQIEILKRMDKLLSLPIPTEYGFNVTFPEFWVEPFSHIRLENENISDFDRSSWDEPIVNLLRIVKNGTVEARSRAVLRLEKLNQSNWLTDTEIENFVSYLWERIDSEKGLPTDVHFLLDYNYLRLLDTSKEDKAKSSFSNYLISGDFPRMNHSVDRDGTSRISISAEKVTYIDEWIGGTEPLFSWQKIKKQKYINWTSSEIVQLLDKLLSWWDEEKYYLHDERHNFFTFLSVPKQLRSKFIEALPLISTVILPKIELGDSTSKLKIIRLLSEMEESGICTSRALPMLLRIDPDNYYEVAQKIRSGLNSTKEEEIVEAVDGVFSWTVLGSSDALPSPPIDIIEELISRVTTRRQPGLKWFINYASGIVRRCSETLSDKQIKSLCISLQYLIKETELPDIKELENIDTMQTTVIPLMEIPEYRKRSAELAYYIYLKFKCEEKEIPQILNEWREACLNDPFPEVRKIWDQV